MKRRALIFGLVDGLLIAALQYTQYRYVVIEHSPEIYGALVAVFFSALVNLARTAVDTRTRDRARNGGGEGGFGPAEMPAPGPFSPDRTQQKTLVITERALEVWLLLRVVSENTIKTYCARTFDKLGASRRTQAVQRGKELELLP